MDPPLPPLNAFPRRTAPAALLLDSVNSVNSLQQSSSTGSGEDSRQGTARKAYVVITVAGVSLPEAAAAVATALAQLGGAQLLSSFRDIAAREVSGGALLRLEPQPKAEGGGSDATEKLAAELHGFVLVQGSELLSPASHEARALPLNLLELIAKVDPPGRLTREVRLQAAATAGPTIESAAETSGTSGSTQSVVAGPMLDVQATPPTPARQPV